MEIIQELTIQNDHEIEIPLEATSFGINLYMDRAETHQSYKYVKKDEDFCVTFNNNAFKGLAYLKDSTHIIFTGNCFCYLVFFK